jgi:hypothetical protein
MSPINFEARLCVARVQRFGVGTEAGCFLRAAGSWFQLDPSGSIKLDSGCFLFLQAPTVFQKATLDLSVVKARREYRGAWRGTAACFRILFPQQSRFR